MKLDIFKYCLNNQLDGIVLFLDFEKAYDSVEYNFMFRTLIKFRFGDQFIKLDNTFYNKPIFKLKNNGWLSKSCKMIRDIRQRCSLSVLLFVLVIEILAVQIRNCEYINGLTFYENSG